jgi:hypothetical protein
MIYLKSRDRDDQKEVWVKVDSITAIAKQRIYMGHRDDLIYWQVSGAGFKVNVALEDLPIELKHLMERK